MNTVNIGGTITHAQFFANESGTERLVLSLCNEQTGKDQTYKTYVTIHLFGKIAAANTERLVKGVSVLFTGLQVGTVKKGEEWQTVLKSKLDTEIFLIGGAPTTTRLVEAHTYEAATGKPKTAPARAPIALNDADEDLPF